MIKKKYKCSGDICFILNNKKRKEAEVIEDKVTFLKKNKNLDESIVPKEFNNIYVDEDERYLYVKNLPAAFGDRQNKKGRIYDQESLKKGAIQYKNIIKEYPYFAYMYDGHLDEDRISLIIGKIENIRFDDRIKAILIDFVIYKNSPGGKLVADMIRRGDPINVSIRILAAESITATKEEIKRINPNVVFIEDVSPTLAELFDKQSLEYLYGDMYIQRVDIVSLPSFSETYGINNSSQPIQLPNMNNNMIQTSESFYKKENKVIKKKSIFKNKEIKKYNLSKTLPDLKILKQTLNNIKESLSDLNQLDLNKKRFITFLNQIISDILINEININNPDDNDLRIIYKSDIYSPDNIIDEFNQININNVFNYLKDISQNSKEKININEIIEFIIEDQKNLNLSVDILQSKTLLELYKFIVNIFINELNLEDKEIKFTKNNNFKINENNIKQNRLTVFENLYKDKVEKLIKSKNLKEFLDILFNEILIIHGEKYKNILTFYGAVLEVLKILQFYLNYKHNKNLKKSEKKYKTKIIKQM